MNTKLEYHLPAFQILERNGKNLQNIVEIMKMVTVEHILLRNYREQHLSWTVYFSAEHSRNKISSPKQTALSWSWGLLAIVWIFFIIRYWFKTLSDIGTAIRTLCTIQSSGTICARGTVVFGTCASRLYINCR